MMITKKSWHLLKSTPELYVYGSSMLSLTKKMKRNPPQPPSRQPSITSIEYLNWIGAFPYVDDMVLIKKPAKKW